MEVDVKNCTCSECEKKKKTTAKAYLFFIFSSFKVTIFVFDAMHQVPKGYSELGHNFPAMFHYIYLPNTRKPSGAQMLEKCWISSEWTKMETQKELAST